MKKQKDIDIAEVKVPVKGEDGKTNFEALNQGGKQSDGSMWYKPIRLVPDDHEHNFKMESPSSREAKCDCGFGGAIYPHRAILKNGHIYNLKGQLVI